MIYSFPPPSPSKTGFSKDKQHARPSELGITNTKGSTQARITKHLRRTNTIKEIHEIQ